MMRTLNGAADNQAAMGHGSAMQMAQALAVGLLMIGWWSNMDNGDGVYSLWG